jgi:hypothetical protein
MATAEMELTADEVRRMTREQLETAANFVGHVATDDDTDDDLRAVILLPHDEPRN